MAKRVGIPYKQMAVRVIGPRDEYLAARVQRLDMPSNIPTTDVDELGNPEHAGTTRDIADITATIQAMDVSVKLFSVLTGTDPDAYPGAGVSINELGTVDLVGVVRDEDILDYVKSIHLRKMRVTGFNFTYTVDGNATEEYTFTGTNKRWFKHDVVVDVFDSSDTSPISLSETPITLKNGDSIISYIQDGVYFTEVAGSPTVGEGEYQYNTGTIVLADAIKNYAVAVYHANTGDNLWTDVSDSAIPAAITGKDIDVKIGANDIYRVQSVNIRGTFPVETVREMGNNEIVGTVAQVPQITGDITVLDTDLELIALLTTGDPDSADTEFNMCEFTADDLDLEIILNDPGDACSESGSPLKTVYMPGLFITGDSNTVNVGGLAQQTFNFRSSTGNLYVYSGSR